MQCPWNCCSQTSLARKCWSKKMPTEGASHTYAHFRLFFPLIWGDCKSPRDFKVLCEATVHFSKLSSGWAYYNSTSVCESVCLCVGVPVCLCMLATDLLDNCQTILSPVHIYLHYILEYNAMTPWRYDPMMSCHYGMMSLHHDVLISLCYDFMPGHHYVTLRCYYIMLT